MTYFQSTGATISRAPADAVAALIKAQTSGTAVPGATPGVVQVTTESAYTTQCRSMGIPESMLADCRRMLKIDKMSPEQVVDAILAASQQPATTPGVVATATSAPVAAKQNWLMIGGIAGAAALTLFLLFGRRG